MQKLIEFIENQDTPLYLPSHLEDSKHKYEYFDVQDLETRIQKHDNPHCRRLPPVTGIIRLQRQRNKVLHQEHYQSTELQTINFRDLSLFSVSCYFAHPCNGFMSR